MSGTQNKISRIRIPVIPLASKKKNFKPELKSLPPITTHSLLSHES
uniref:Uncharacterized protein n=1 Tax=Arundo donax TaxID=35708 RepID=A0A0A8Y022_ARUDO